MKLVSAVKISMVALLVALSADLSTAEAAASCSAIKKEVKVTCARAAEAVRKGGKSRAARIQRATKQRVCLSKAKKFKNYCSVEYCGYKMPECPAGLACIQVIQTQTYKGLAALKSDGAQVLHIGACQ